MRTPFEARFARVVVPMLGCVKRDPGVKIRRDSLICTGIVNQRHLHTKQAKFTPVPKKCVMRLTVSALFDLMRVCLQFLVAPADFGMKKL